MGGKLLPTLVFKLVSQAQLAVNRAPDCEDNDLDSSQCHFCDEG
jgi:hypothetical protein